MPHELLVEPRRTLLRTLRDELHLTGAKPACEQSNCGACTVHLDGLAVYACSVLTVECDGRVVTTIEGVADGNELHPLQEAFIACDALQCGFCTPGQIMSALALLDRDPQPTDETIRHAMSGNLCRCGAYLHIIEAVASLAGGRDAA